MTTPPPQPQPPPPSRQGSTDPRGSALICGMLVVALALLTTACTSSRGPYTPIAESTRDSVKAQSLTQEAATLLDTNPAKAERLLREALTADLYHGPAHNNLGVVFLAQHRLFEAAGEFEWARKLLPGHPDPRVNLAVVLERAGRTDDALDAYAGALEVYPNHIGAIQGLARLQIRAARIDERTPVFLDEIALRGEDEQWREWARLQRIRAESGTP